MTMYTPSSDFTLKGAPNFRDIGGYKTTDGMSVARNKIFRSERLASLTHPDLEVVRKLGIRTVCDLRSASERTLHPNRWPEGHPFDEFHCNILIDVRAANGSVFEPLRVEPTATGARRMMIALYRAMPDSFAPHLAQLVNRIISGRLPMLIHCTAGKDRTGFAAAMLLSVLGVHRDAIYSDYLLTERYSNHEERIADVTQLVTSQLGHKPDGEIIKTITGVDVAYLGVAFETIESSYGSVNEYLLQACKIDESHLMRMKKILIE